MAHTHLAPAAGPICQLVFATLPLALVLAFFLWETSRRPFAKCNEEAQFNANENDETFKEFFVSIWNLLIDECFNPVSLVEMTVIFLVLAQLWGILAVYVSFFVPRRRRLLKEYLNDGIACLGDVYYQLKHGCGKFSTKHIGHVTYPHPNKDVYPVFVCRTLDVLEHFTREQVTILMLPDRPFSGQAKTDLEIDFAACQRNRRKNMSIALISWAWFIFTLFAPIYILLTMDMIRDDQNGNDDGLSTQVISWVTYGVVALVIIPGISIIINKVAWDRYLYQQTRAGRIAEEGDIKPAWLDMDGESHYEPPSVTTGSYAMTSEMRSKYSCY